jgi:hypothetical protein
LTAPLAPNRLPGHKVAYDLTGQITIRGVAMPDSYVIQELLNSGTQPYPDLPEEELDALAASIRKNGLYVKIQLGEDGTLVDGHQRLKAMQRNRKKRIQSSDVEVLTGVTRANAFERAVGMNWTRRQLTGEMKAARIRLWQVEQRWSQGKIAKILGVSQPAISLILKAHPAPQGLEPPTSVIGLDGKEQTVNAPAPKPEKPELPQWHAGPSKTMSGDATRKLLGIKDGMESLNVVPLGGLDDVTRQATRWALREIRDVADTMIRRLDDAPAEVLTAPTALDNVAPSTDPDK